MHQIDRKSPASVVLRANLVSCGLLLALLVGCADEAPITTYEVEKDSPPRILVVTVEDGQHVWFIKLNGSAAKIEEHLDEFQDFLDSVEFEPTNDPTSELSSQPTWTLPKGWIDSERGKTGEFKRFASFSIPTDTELLDVSVTNLSAPSTGIGDQYLLMNLNRWRKQITLDPRGPAENWQDDFEPISIDGVPGLLADLTGEAHLDLSPRPVAPEAQAGEPFRKPEFEYKVPDHWQDRGAARMVDQEWRVGEGETEDEVVRITLSFVGGGMRANINRWRDQVGLSEPTSDDVKIEEIEMDGNPAVLVDLIGESKSIVGVVAPQNEQLALFVKMIGPVKMVEKERENFVEFTKTLKLKR